MMDYTTFLNHIIDDGIKAAQHDYAPENYSGDRPTQRGLLKGSVEGFEACRGKNPVEIAALLNQATSRSNEAFRRVHLKELTDEEYWEGRGFNLEIEWVANVLSAAFQNQGLPVIVPPTIRGVMKAAEIVGVKDEAPAER